MKFFDLVKLCGQVDRFPKEYNWGYDTHATLRFDFTSPSAFAGAVYKIQQATQEVLSFSTTAGDFDAPMGMQTPNEFTMQLHGVTLVLRLRNDR